MSRLRADLLLLLASMIWGLAFIAQKTGMQGLGPFSFVGLRFTLSTIVILPFALLENRRQQKSPVEKLFSARTFHQSIILCVTFVGAVLLQQIGLQTTTVTNAGFLTGLYVIFVPIIAAIVFRRRPSWVVFSGCALSVFGVWLLNGASFNHFGHGDLIVVMCAFSFAIQVFMTGVVVQRTGRPFTVVVLQYAAVAALGLFVGIVGEGISWHAITTNLPQLAYAGLISGGIAYTLQAVAQQHTPASEASVIMAAEALFAALGGVWLLHEHLSLINWAGCACILLSILAVEMESLRAVRRKINLV